MLTITGGVWKGQRLKVAKGAPLRPTASRTKSAIFNIIDAYRMKQELSNHFEGEKCLDLYAGVGGLGLEALSRGAGECTFVEYDRRSLQGLTENIKHLKCSGQAHIIQAKVERSYKQIIRSAPFDYIFMDPPYKLNPQEVLDEMAKGGAHPYLSEAAMIVIEHDPALEMICPDGLEFHSHRVLGPAGISVFIKAS